MSVTAAMMPSFITTKFDGNGRGNFRVSAEEIASAYASVPAGMPG